MARVLDARTSICCVLVVLCHVGLCVRDNSAHLAAGEEAAGAPHELDKRNSDWDSDVAGEQSKRGFSSFRYDLGKRLSDKRFGYGLRADLGKRSDDQLDEKRGWSNFRGDLGKRLSSFRYDLGKRSYGYGFRGDLGKRSDEGALSELDRDLLLDGAAAEKRRVSNFRYDLGKRDKSDKRYMFRGDLGKRFFRTDLSKKRMLRLDLGKRSVGETIHKSDA